MEDVRKFEEPAPMRDPEVLITWTVHFND
jgi:hypothetical protein